MPESAALLPPSVPDLVRATNVRLGLIADTHVFPGGARQVPPEVYDYFRRARPDVIVHAGDIASAGVLDDLGLIAAVLAVRGNNDSGAFGATLPLEIDLIIADRRVCIVHGDGPAGSARKEARAHAEGQDVVIYGHSHRPMIERAESGALMVNPGSPTDRRFGPHFGIGLLDFNPDRIWPHLVLFERPADLTKLHVPER